MMQPQQIRNMLAQTLDDFRLSRGERSALNQILDHIEPTEHDLSVYRAMAFDLARDAVEQTDRTTILEWLESVVKLLEQHGGNDQQAVRAESHFSPQDDCPRRIQQLLSRAKISVEICVFTITDDRLSSAILDAHRRKVKVQIISDDDKSGDRGSDIDRLSAAGIDVRIDRSESHMHHKFAIFDRSLLLTGSYNWTRSAANRNEENFIITGDRRFLDPFAKMFEDLWKRFE
jgi:phosphatidylserine/phosphatidylglycerophosphate/cardiolipin synthase-like enzyme